MKPKERTFTISLTLIVLLLFLLQEKNANNLEIRAIFSYSERELQNKEIDLLGDSSVYTDSFLGKKEVPLEAHQIAFQKLTTSITSSSDTLDLIRDKIELEELLFAHPELIARISDLLLDENSSSRGKLALIHSLQQVGNSEAQALLSKIVADQRYEHSEKMQAIISIADLKNPERQVIDLLWETYHNAELSPELQSASVLNIGVLASNALYNNQSIAQELVAKLESELIRDQDSIDLLIEAIGNSESERTFAIVSPYLNSDNSEIRAVAAYALRFSRDQDSADKLIDIIKNDPSSEVKVSAIHGLNINTKDREKVVTEMGNVLFEDDDSQVRLAIIRKLGLLNRDLKVSRDILKAQLRMESDQSNYEHIVDMLHQ